VQIKVQACSVCHSGSLDPREALALQFLSGHKPVIGWPSGTASDFQDTMLFSALAGVRSMDGVFRLERAAEAYARMMSGQARFRVVLTTSS
jgi:propanol-preferring alcohol dehydrogenase